MAFAFPTICLRNHSTAVDSLGNRLLTDADVLTMSAAWNLQLRNDLPQGWAIRPGRAVMAQSDAFVGTDPNAWCHVFLDDLPPGFPANLGSPDGAHGVQGITGDVIFNGLLPTFIVPNRPISFSLTRHKNPDGSYTNFNKFGPGPSICSRGAHEAIEMMVNPDMTRQFLSPFFILCCGTEIPTGEHTIDGQPFVSTSIVAEACDPVGNITYEVNGCTVPNFAFEAGFSDEIFVGTLPPPTPPRFDFLGLATGPYQIAPGGAVTFYAVASTGLGESLPAGQFLTPQGQAFVAAHCPTFPCAPVPPPLAPGEDRVAIPLSGNRALNRFLIGLYLPESAESQASPQTNQLSMHAHFSKMPEVGLKLLKLEDKP